MDSENKISYLESAKCREIVSEIMKFGVNQNQILTLIKLLALELEDRKKMLAVTNCIEEVQSKSVEVSNIVV
tara:strand:- start:471 stop:686 length:216 start_codon:yes stop_codon:yes gene_type:complete